MGFSEFKGELDPPVTEKTIRKFAGMGSDGLPMDKVPDEFFPGERAMLTQNIPGMSMEKGGITQTSATPDVYPSGFKPFTGEVDAAPKIKPFDGDLDKEGDSLGASAVGLGEALLNMGSQIPAGLAGGANFLGGLIATGGNIDAAKAIQEGTQERINDKIEYKPRTKMGKMWSGIRDESLQSIIDQGGKAGNDMAGLIGQKSDAAETIGKVIAEGALNVLPFEGALPRGKSIPKGLDSFKKLESLKSDSVKVPETDLPKLDMTDVPPRLPETPVGETPLPELNLWNGEQTAGFPKLHEEASIPEGGVKPYEAAPEALTAAKERVAQEAQVDVESRYKNGEDFNTSLENPQMREALKKAQEDAAYASKEPKSDISDLEKYAELQKEQDYNLIKNAEQVDIARKAGELDYQHLKDIGDSTLMSQRDSFRLLDTLKAGNLKGALGHIAENHALPAYRDLAGYLSKLVEGVGVKLHDDVPTITHGDRSVSGYFDNASNTIGFSIRGGLSPHTVLHETVHALTSQFIRMKPSAIQTKALVKLFNDFKASKESGKYGHIINEREFIAEAFSNPEFQKILKDIPVTKAPGGFIKNAWDKFVNTVRNVLGIKDTKMSNALDHTLDLGKQIIEQSTPEFRTASKEFFKRNGMPKIVADLMAEKTPEKAPEIAKDGARLEAIRKMSPAAQALKDYIPENFPMEAIQAYARTQPDMPSNIFNKAFNLMTSGGLYQSLKTKNIVVKKTYETMRSASSRAEHTIQQLIQDPKTGLSSIYRDLSATDKGEVVTARVLADAEQHPLDSASLAKAGFNEKQIKAVMASKDVMDKAYNALNEARAAIGKAPVDRRVGYAVSKSTGDFRVGIFQDGKPIGFVGSNNLRGPGGLNGILEKVRAEHPEWTIGETKFMGRGEGRKINDSRQAAFMEALQFATDHSPESQALVKTLHDIMIGDSYNYLNAKKHTMTKKGTFGSEGRKPWETIEQNAQDFMKAEITYAQTMFKWAELSKATKELAPLLSDESIKMPYAKQWAEAYIDTHLGLNPTEVGRTLDKLMGSIGKETGIGSTNLMNIMRGTKNITNKILLGLNPMFLAVNVLQPAAVIPSIKAILRGRGLNMDFDAGTGYKYLVKGAITGIKSITKGGIGKLDGFESRALDYAHKNSVYDSAIIDHSTQIQKSTGYYANKVAEAGINKVESSTRGSVFLSIGHMLKDAGMRESEGLFEVAHKLTNQAMHDYHSAEASPIFQHLGPVGTMAKNLTKFKMGSQSHLAMLAREIGNTDSRSAVPLLTALANGVAFSGILGTVYYQEADIMYKHITKMLGKPDTLTGVVLRNAPDLASYGLPSLAGIDMSNRMGMADVIPDTVGKALFGGGSKITDIATSGVNAITSPSEMNLKRLVREASPGVITGLEDRNWFSTTNVKGEEMGISRKPSDFHNIQGQVPRNDADKFWKTLGASGVHESKEKAIAYNNGLVQQSYAETRKAVISNLADLQFSKGRLDKTDLDAAKTKYIKAEGDPNIFASALQKEIMDQKTSAKQREMLRDSKGGVTGAYNLKRAFNK